MENKRLAQIALVSLLALGCMLVLQPFVAAMLFAAVISVTTWPLYEKLLARVGGKVNRAALLMTLLLTLLIVIPMAFLAANVAEVMPGLADNIGNLLGSISDTPPSWLQKIPVAGALLDGYWHTLASSHEELNKLLQQFYPLARNVLLKTVTLTGEGLLQLVLALFIAFFFYRDGKGIARRMQVASRKLAGDLGEQMLGLARSTVMGVMIGIVGTAIAQALVMLLGLLIAGVPAPVLLAAATFFLSMVPVGPPLIWAGAAFWLFGNGESGWAIFMVLWGLLLVSSVDNFLKPLLISRTSSLPILLITLGVFGGALAFGFTGIFLGPTLLALGLILTEKTTAPTSSTP